jgi:hypothetical protein
MRLTQADAARLAEDMTREAGRAVNPDEVIERLASFDEDAVIARAESAYTVEIWDKTSPINGLPAEDVIASRTDIPADGTVALIRDASGAVLVFQPHLPEEGIKRMTPAVARSTGAKMVKENAQREARSQMLGYLRSSVGINVGEAEKRRREDEAVEQRARALMAEHVERVEQETRQQVQRDETERILKGARQR